MRDPSNARDIEEFTGIINSLNGLAREAADYAGKLNRENIIHYQCLTRLAAIQEQITGLANDFTRDIEKSFIHPPAWPPRYWPPRSE